jgi:hypothetical protein
MPFCTDTDLLHWEPNILKDAAFASQTLLSGTGNLVGTAFTITSGSLTADHVQAGQVIVLTGAVAGCFPIASVDNTTQLTLSVLYDGLLPEDGSGTASPVGTATGLGYTIRTFWAQRRLISDLIQQAAGLNSGETATSAILNPNELKRACALGTLQLIYSALAAASTSPAPLDARADLYERLYRRALRSAKVELDLNGDGQLEVIRALNILEFQRV